jgi:hypothetical protein
VTTVRGALCLPVEPTRGILAALANSTANELRRWRPQDDFVYTNSTLSLSPVGRIRCPGAVCSQTEFLLAFQDWANNGIPVFGQPLDVAVLRARIGSFWERQMVCVNGPDNHNPDDCPTELHDLVRLSRVPSGCGEQIRFQAYQAGTTTPLQYPQQLKNLLKWVGHPDNPWITVVGAGDQVKIEPPADPIFEITPNSPTAPYCTTAIPVGATSGPVIAQLGGRCQCMTSPVQPVYTFKPGILAGMLRCRP